MLFCALLASAQDNYIVTTDGTTYLIDSPYDFESANHSRFGTDDDLSFKSNNSDVAVPRETVLSVTLEIPLDRAMETDEKYFCGCLFYNCTNLTEANIFFCDSDDCTIVGDSFCDGMFYNCSSLESLSDNFSLPQNLTIVGDSFCDCMFYNCSSLKSLPDNFSLPQDLTNGGDSFCAAMFYNCSSLTGLPDNFNLSQNLTSVGDSFCHEMFCFCSSLTSLPDDFNIPQKITGSVGYVFCHYMFYDCRSLLSLPDSFNLPKGITSVGGDFCHGMFDECLSLSVLPDDFNLPQSITVVDAGFCYGMFHYCALIALPDNFNIPQDISTDDNYFCYQIFYGCSALQPGETVAITFPAEAIQAFENTSFKPTTASAGSTYYTKGNSDVRTISYYDQDGNFVKTQYVFVNERIGSFSITGEDLLLDDSQVLSGWKYADETEATTFDVVSGDINLYAIVKPSSLLYVEDNNLISTDYYDLDGKKLSEPQRGMNIVVESYSDGTQKSTKMLQK